MSIKDLQGHIPHNPAPRSEAPTGKLLAEERRAADQVDVDAGVQHFAAPDPGRTAAGDGNGHDIDFWTEGAEGSEPGPVPDGHQKIDPVLGG